MPKTPKKTTKNFSGNPPSKPQNRRKRRPPQKHPPQKKSRVLTYLAGLIVAGALVASGYMIGAKKQSGNAAEPVTPVRKASQPKAKEKAKGKIVLTAAPKPHKRSPSAMEILRYGFEEDAQSEDTPDVSWYVPGRASTPKSSEKSSTSASIPPAPPSHGKRPKLAIIIDDVSHKYQIDAIKALPYHITPSIFPPSELSKTSNRLTQYVKHYMVHLPMESGSAAMNRMQGMLFTRFSRARVQARVDEIRRLFPHARFVNNHTGSVYTSNYRAMKQLYGMLRAKGFVFIDSRTTGKSVVRRIAHEHHDRYIARDIFLDNVQQEALILKQLKKAVRIAKKRGFAIAIGHPHKATMKALHHAGKILQGVETVYIDELYP